MQWPIVALKTRDNNVFNDHIAGTDSVVEGYSVDVSHYAGRTPLRVNYCPPSEFEIDCFNRTPQRCIDVSAAAERDSNCSYGYRSEPTIEFTWH